MFAGAGMMAADGRCKTLDASADGYVRGEACVVIKLRCAGYLISQICGNSCLIESPTQMARPAQKPNGAETVGREVQRL